MPDLRAITLPNNVTYNLVDGDARAHLVSQYSMGCSWQGDDAQGEIVGSANYGEILNCLHNGGLPILYIESPTGEFIPGYPCMSDSAGIYQFVAFATDGYILYTAFEGDQTETQSYVYKSRISIPDYGTVGQVLTKTASGYAWQSLPVYDGGVS